MTRLIRYAYGCLSGFKVVSATQEDWFLVARTGGCFEPEYSAKGEMLNVSRKKGLSAEKGMTIVGAVAGSTAGWNASYEFELYMGENTLKMIMFTEIKLLITAAGGIIGGKIGKKCLLQNSDVESCKVDL